MSTKWATSIHTIYGDEWYNVTIIIIGELVKRNPFSQIGNVHPHHFTEVTARI